MPSGCAVDVPVAPVDLDTLNQIVSLVDEEARYGFLAGWKTLRPQPGCCFATSAVCGFNVRIWTELDGLRASEIPQIPAPFEGWSCADPEWCLETLPLSPDFELLYEDRARLAETLYFDAMPPEQFAVFRKYVR